MLDDHTLSYGRHTNWKWIIALVLLAVLALAGAFWGRNGAPLPQWQKTEPGLDWQALPWTDGEALVKTESGVLAISPGRLWHMDDRGTVTAQVEAENQQLQPISGESAGAWGKSAVYLWDGADFCRMPISGDLLGCSGNGACLAVILGASGCYTRTRLLRISGETLGEITLTGAAMVETTLTDHRMAGLCLDTGGSWSLRFYDLTGTECAKLELPAGETYHIKAMDSGVALLGDQRLSFYDEAGHETGTYQWESGVPVLWDTDSSWAAILLEDGGRYTISTVDAHGNLLGAAVAAGPLRSLRAEGNQLYALDYQTLRVYDTLCTALERTECGARAAAMAPADGAAWLLGNGEIARVITK